MPSQLAAFLDPAEVTVRRLIDDGIIPNSKLPVLLYRHAVRLPPGDAASAFEQIFTANEWTGTWRNGVYPFHHYHSTAHEVLGVFRGSARVQLGGERGLVNTLNPGDVVIIPAGVGHKNLGSSADFGVVGAYPLKQEPDMNYGKASERPRADQNIARVPRPARDPVYGLDGPLRQHWR